MGWLILTVVLAAVAALAPRIIPRLPGWLIDWVNPYSGVVRSSAAALALIRRESRTKRHSRNNPTGCETVTCPHPVVPFLAPL